jgi:uncharacterized protein with GYD domain
MSTFIILMKLTDQGAKAIKEAPARVQAGIKGWEAMGGKMLGFYVTMGEYDYIAFGEAPSDEVAAAFALQLGSLGNVHTTTLKAFPVEQFTKIIKMLP